jgi:cyclohexanecarboxylate-CoA ligase
MLRLAESRVLVAPQSFRGFDHGALARQLAAEIPGLQLLEIDFSTPAAGFLRGARLAPDDVTQLMYTSGTTGEPKGVLHTSNTLLGAVAAFARHMRIGAADVIFMPSPLAHQLGFCYGMLMSLMLGVPLVADIWRAARAQLINANGDVLLRRDAVSRRSSS